MINKPQKPNAAQLRGQIDQGEAGDKSPGVDPAAAPLETDAEAGGAPPTTEEIKRALAREKRAPGVDNAASPEKTPDGG